MARRVAIARERQDAERLACEASQRRASEREREKRAADARASSEAAADRTRQTELEKEARLRREAEFRAIAFEKARLAVADLGMDEVAAQLAAVQLMVNMSTAVAALRADLERACMLQKNAAATATTAAGGGGLGALASVVGGGHPLLTLGFLAIAMVAEDVGAAATLRMRDHFNVKWHQVFNAMSSRERDLFFFMLSEDSALSGAAQRLLS